MKSEDQKRFEREHGQFYHPRTNNQIAYVSDSELPYKTVKKEQYTFNNGNITLTLPKTDKLNASIPQVSYHRIVNAKTLTPVKIVKGTSFIIWKAPENYVLKGTNHKKHVYPDKNYASLSKLRRNQAPRWIPPIKERENKVRITKSGKVKMRRF